MNLEYFIQTLTKEQKDELACLLSVDGMNENIRFENGRFCPHCYYNKPIKRGIVRGNQRFYCSECKRYFTANVKTILNYTKKDIRTWKIFIKRMFSTKPATLKELATELPICERTAFNWRHKILRVLEQKFMSDRLSGIIEADETFILQSRKGKHIDGIIGRRSGGVSRYRGISHEQVGILVGIDRDKNVISKVYGNGKISGANVVTTFTGRIDKKSLLITDGCTAYREFAEYENIELKQIKGGKSIGNDIHLNTVNNYHSGLKRWLYSFNGVSTRYLNRYLAWFKFIKQKNDCAFLFNELILR